MNVKDQEEIIDWNVEASAMIADIIKHVKSAAISEKFASENQIYINITTLEEKNYCIEMSVGGFRVAAHEHDMATIDPDFSIYYETPYSLLNDISVKYREAFANDLNQKLLSLK